MDSSRAPRLAAQVVAALMFSAARAHGQAVPLLTATELSVSSATANEDLATIATQLGRDALTGTALSAATEERYAIRDTWTDSLAEVRASVSQHRRRYNSAVASNHRSAMDAALRALEQAADTMIAQPLALDHSVETREAVTTALVFIANVSLTDNPARSTDALRKLAGVLPDLVLSARVASRAVRTLFREQVQLLANASLVVRTAPPGCQVQRNGALVGNAPVHLQGLVAGQHRITIRCGARTSLLHRVTVGAGATSTVEIDIGIDRAIEFGDGLTLRYDIAPVTEARFVGDAATIGDALGVDRVLVYRPATRRVAVVDVIARSVEREIAVSNTRELSTLLRRPGATIAPTSDQPAASRVAFAPRVAVLSQRLPTVRASVERVAPRSRAAPSRAPIVAGAIVAGAGAVVAVGGTVSWAVANDLSEQSRRVGSDGLALAGVRTSVASAEPPLRALAAAGWLTSAALEAAAVTMVVLGAARREATAVHVSFDGATVRIAGAFW